MGIEGRKILASYYFFLAAGHLLGKSRQAQWTREREKLYTSGELYGVERIRPFHHARFEQIITTLLV